MDLLHAAALLLLLASAWPNPKTQDGKKIVDRFVFQFNMDIEEMGTDFTEIIELDEDTNTEVFDIPSHNEFEATKFIHDFDKNLTLRVVTKTGECFVNDFSSMRAKGYMSPPKELMMSMKAGEHHNDNPSSVEVVLTDWAMGRELSEEERQYLGAKQRDACSDRPIRWLFLLQDHANVRQESHSTQNYTYHPMSRQRREDIILTCTPDAMKFRCKRNILHCQYIYYETCDYEDSFLPNRRFGLSCRDKNTLHVIDQVVCCKECCAVQSQADCLFQYCETVGNFACNDSIHTC